jgi:hypothetical protein
MENYESNWSREHLEGALHIHLTAVRYILHQLFVIHGINPDQLDIETELGIGTVTELPEKFKLEPEDLPPAA